MPRLLKDGKIIADPWLRFDDEAPLPATGEGVIVSLKRWQAERDALSRSNRPLGVALPADADIGDIVGDLQRLSLITLRLASFADGRAFSQARLLRERYGFAGELRATGHVLREQFLHLDRCGVNAVELAEGDDEAAWRQILSQIDVFYQPTGDRRRTVLQHRHPA
jgi:uncharacterized protein (DUF934 family)